MAKGKEGVGRGEGTSSMPKKTTGGAKVNPPSKKGAVASSSASASSSKASSKSSKSAARPQAAAPASKKGSSGSSTAALSIPASKDGKYTYVTERQYAQLQRASSKLPSASYASKMNALNNTLCQLAGKADRQLILEEAAREMAALEEEMLPTYGGRAWRVFVTLSEDESAIRKQAEEKAQKLAAKQQGVPNAPRAPKPAAGRPQPPSRSKKPPPNFAKGSLFRWYRGSLELGVLPSLLSEASTRVARDLKGLYKTVPPPDSSHHVLLRDTTAKGKECSLEALANDRCKPRVKRHWLSPQYETLREWKDVVKECKDNAEASRIIDKIIFGIGARGVLLKPTKASKAIALEAGHKRFLKDGLWVVGQEDSWQAGNEAQLLRREALGLNVKMDTIKLGDNKLTGLKCFVKDKRSRHRLKRQREMERVAGGAASASSSLTSSKVKEEADTAEDAPDTVQLFSLEDAERELKRQYIKLLPEEKKKWEAIAAAENAKLGAQALKDMEAKRMETAQAQSRLKSIKSMSVLASSATAAAASNTGPCTKPTDEEIAMQPIVPQAGMSVKIKFTDDWYKGTITSVTNLGDSPTKVWGIAVVYEDGQQEDTTYPEGDIVVVAGAHDSVSSQQPSTLASMCVDAQHAVEPNTSAISSSSSSSSSLSSSSASSSSSIPALSEALLPPPPPLPESVRCKVPSFYPFDEWLSHRKQMWRLSRANAAAGLPPPPRPALLAEEAAELERQARGNDLAAAEKQRKVEEMNESLVGQSCRIYEPADDQWHNCTCVSYDKEAQMHVFQFSKKKFLTLNVDERSIVWEKSRVINTSSFGRLAPRYLELCRATCMDHYERVMHTVKSRGLFHELKDGFDVLRERGFGRYDMNVPELDTPAFSFLTDANAAWMPIVKKCLGDNCRLIHKGFFLSLPGSHHQIYHQDGVHLNDKKQLPCHAVNVFIPLVDLTISNGATEFILGTHILENDDWDKSKSETPTPPAGTPVIFDYRLGHRGMGNSTTESRPILYLTYSASDSFSDSVNFSQKRYHKLGEILEKPMTREERTAKRLEQQQAMEAAEAAEEAEEALREEREGEAGEGEEVNIDLDEGNMDVA